MQFKLQLGARLILGLIFFVFGLNGFLQFIQMPPMPLEAGQFMGALGATGYMFPVVKVLEIICGALFLLGAFNPLALMLIAPIIVNIVLFHAVLAPAGMILPIVILILWIYLTFFSADYSPICKQVLRCPMMEKKKANK